MKRSYLFVPGNRPERFVKAVASGAGAVVLDLEDAVPPEEKLAARAAVCDWLAQRQPADPGAWVRINSADTEYFEDDVRALAAVKPLGIMLPKTESAAPLREIIRLLDTLEIPVIPIIESALGLMNALEIAKGPRTERLAFGSIDFQLDTGILNDAEGLLFARSTLVITSVVARIGAPIDGVTMQIGDAAQLQSDVARARELGFGAKLCIHPNQVALTESGFRPSEEELRWARAVIAASDAASGHAVRLDNKLIDLPVVERARRMLLDEVHPGSGDSGNSG
ncbi:MAG: aldolase [Herminiimonas sp.]|nr:aldolase [Herminiimonas sp.]